MSLLIKSCLSLFMLFQLVLALFSMLELKGHDNHLLNPAILRWIHRINGYIFIGLCFVLTYYCLIFLRATHGEISFRVLLHSLFAIGVMLMLMIKILFIRRYRKFMSQASAFGLTIFFLAAGMIATSGGYYLVTSTELPANSQKVTATQSDSKDQTMAEKGQELFNRWCGACHDPNSKSAGGGPGLQGILKGDKLPVSHRDATVDNVRRQIRTPFRLMPPQSQLSDEDIDHIIEFLKTL